MLRFLTSVSVLLISTSLLAQVSVSTPGTPKSGQLVPATAVKVATEAKAAQPAVASTAEKKTGEATKDGADKKATTTTAKGPGKSVVIKRGNAPEGETPSEVILRHEPGDRIGFSFVGAKWLPVLQSIAKASNMSLDWQELPGDYLNLVTQRSYTIAEARDVINRHLMARGYTMLTDGEDLEVIKLSELNTARVPRVTPDELDQRFDNEFAKVSFRLNWLIAEEAVAELDAMKSKYGKLVHLSATNRIEAIDTVKNLKDIRDLLNTEQSNEGEQKIVSTIPLKHRRASEVIELVREFMGLSSGGQQRSSSGSSNSAQMVMQMQKQMFQQMQQTRNSSSKPGGKYKPPIEVSMVLNQRENSILVKAPPDKMNQIKQAIMALDVESGSANSLLGNLSKYKSYQLESFDAQPLVDMLNELGDLAPQTQLRVDEDKNLIIAYATIADHLTISSLIEKLDEKRRHFEVLQLRRLESDFVAGTIRFLMGEDGEEEDNSSNSYGYWGGYSSRNNDKKDKSNEFRVDADVQNNRLLLFASEQELEQIEDLLVKLGEIPEKDSRESRRRLINVDPNVDPEEFLKRIEALWPKENKLNVNPVPEEVKQRYKEENAEENDQATPKETDAPAGESTPPAKPVQPAPQPDPSTDPGPPVKPTVTQAYDVDTFFASVTQTEAPVQTPVQPADPSDQTPAVTSGNLPPELTPEQKALKEIFGRQRDQRRQPSPQDAANELDSLPPVNIGFTPAGRLIITSDDAGALDDLEEILMPFTQSRKKYVIFTLKYASAGWTASTLREFFEDDSGSDSVLDWWGDVQKTKKSNSDRLSARPVPRFIADSYSSTILVRGADARQIKTIEELIKLYDTPEPDESRSVRVSEMFTIKHSKATVIANVIKDVYRDLLSANDKALEKKDEKGSVNRDVTYIRGSGSDGADEETPIQFKGMLSVGVDEISNTIIISTSEGLLSNIRVMIERLDEAAKQTSHVKVLKVNTRLDPRYLKQRLTEILGPTKVNTSKTNKNQSQQQNGQPNNGQPPNSGGK